MRIVADTVTRFSCCSVMSELRRVPSCSSEMDDDGVTYLWQQDHDANTSTPMMCAGDSPLVEASYDAFGYDAVYAVAHGTPRPLATAILASRTLVRC